MFKSVKESTRNELLIDKVMIIKSSLQIREFYNLFLEIVHIYLIVYVHIYLIVYRSCPVCEMYLKSGFTEMRKGINKYFKW